MEQWEIEKFIDWMIKMMTGKVNDRFYTQHIKRNHLIKMFVYERNDFNSKSVIDYIEN